VADQLVTLAQIKARIFPTGLVDATDDTLLGELNDQITDLIQELTGRRFVAAAGQSYTVDTKAGSVIEVPKGVRAVTALGIASSDQPDTGGTYSAVAATDILLRPTPLERRPGWPATRLLIRGTTGRLVTALNGAQMTIDEGFVSVPPSVQAIALDAVATAYEARQAGDANAIGADASPLAVWAHYFGPGTVQYDTLMRFRGGIGIA
jgi:hypothetical protein